MKTIFKMPKNSFKFSTDIIHFPFVLFYRIRQQPLCSQTKSFYFILNHRAFANQFFTMANMSGWEDVDDVDDDDGDDDNDDDDNHNINFY